ncbi:MAG: alkaline phosphatase [Rhodobacteraceae bacterium]|nr:alkaline phosphatase [Paracoccaceae bacterium]
MTLSNVAAAVAGPKTFNLRSLNSKEVIRFDSGIGEGGSEVVAHHAGKLYVTNGEQDRIDVFNLTTGKLEKSLDLSTIANFGGINSVTVSTKGVAVAVERVDPVDDETPAEGAVAFFDLNAKSTDTPTDVVTVGHLPDMVTFSKDGTKVFVANEGEALDNGDPAGSISVIDVATKTAKTFDFTAFDAQVDQLRADGVRIFPGKLPSNDFEPEYITEGPDGLLYVTLQENNAVAVFDPTTEAFTKILPLGTVDHSLAGNGIDPSDKDDAINIRTVPVEGLRMPDAIASVQIKGKTFFLTANEGDARDEDERIKDITLDPTLFPNAAALQDNADLGRLGISSIDGDTDGDGDYDALYSYGSRSFTIFSSNGRVVFDSGDDFEQYIADNRVANAFNNDDFPTDTPGTVDENRSDNKGPEPEAIEVGVVDGRTLAFIGLERDSGIMIYDISNPNKAKFLHYIEGQTNGDVSPEVIEFIAASESLTGKAQLAVSYEVSGTTTLIDLDFGQRIVGTDSGETLNGTLSDDVILGRGAADTVNAGEGDDRILGGTGNDNLNGQDGDDQIRGGAGEDVISGGKGDDTLRGGFGEDTFVFALGDGNDTILGFADGDMIDLSATGLTAADVTITRNTQREYTVDYGGLGDSIDVTLRTPGDLLTTDDLIFV